MRRFNATHALETIDSLTPLDASGPEDDFLREEILNHLMSPHGVRYEDDHVVVDVSNGIVLIRPHPTEHVVIFDYVDDLHKRTNFWMNTHSVGIVLATLNRFKEAPKSCCRDLFTGLPELSVVK